MSDGPHRDRRRGLLSALFLALLACGSQAPSATRVGPAPKESAWQERYDFTGDGVLDRVEVAFTGGAHCCYKLAVVDGANGRVGELPFELDGGYVGGLDLSQPERFAIVNGRGGRAHLVLEVATYGGEPQALPADGWGLGVASHRIEVGFDGEVTKPRVVNLGWRCEAAMLALGREQWEAWEGLPRNCSLRQVLEALDAVAAEGGAELEGGNLRLRREATRAADDTRLELFLLPAAAASPAASDHDLLVERIVWHDPARAAAAAAAWSARPFRQEGALRRWDNGLAVESAAAGTPARLILMRPR